MPEDRCESHKPNEIQCAKGEIYSECGSSCKESFIHNYNKEYDVCAKSCEPGCYCIQGFFRTKDDTCEPPPHILRTTERPFLDVPDEEELMSNSRTRPPDRSCHENEEYIDCGNSCEESCDSIMNPTLCTEFGAVRVFVKRVISGTKKQTKKYSLN